MARASVRLEAVEVAWLAGLSDAEVVARVRGGEPALFEVLMRRHNQRLYRAIRSVLRDEVECEDALQQAWLAAFSHLGQFQAASSFTTWLTRIALNEALSRQRRRRGPVLLETLPEEGPAMRSPLPDPERRAADRELGGMLEESLDRLPAALRTVFVLREVDGRSTAEVAEVLGVSEEVVKTRLHRARAALRDLLLARVGAAAPSVFTFLGRRCDRVVAAVLDRVLGPPPAA